ncbi:MAG: IclR family transcriptional regulator [Halanaerobiaceae bacterium]
MSENNHVKSVIKAMRIYEQLVGRGEPISLSSLSKRVKLNISTVHRLLNTLLSMGYVEQNDKGHYRLGFRSYKMADIINDSFDLKRLVHPYLKKIAEQCNETTNLVILEDYQVVYIDQVQSTNMVRMFAGMGSRGAAYCTGAGKVLLAQLGEEELNNYIEETEFKAFTENTITCAERLKEELARIKQQGFALDREEKEKGVRCAAAPIFGKKGKTRGAISVSGPSTRISEDYLKETLVPLVCEQAGKITDRLQQETFA